MTVECDNGVEFCIEEGGEMLILKAVEAEFIYCTSQPKGGLDKAIAFALSE